MVAAGTDSTQRYDSVHSYSLSSPMAWVKSVAVPFLADWIGGWVCFVRAHQKREPSLPWALAGVSLAFVGPRLYAFGGHSAGGTCSNMAAVLNESTSTWDTVRRLTALRMGILMVRGGG